MTLGASCSQRQPAEISATLIWGGPLTRSSAAVELKCWYRIVENTKDHRRLTEYDTMHPGLRQTFLSRRDLIHDDLK